MLGPSRESAAADGARLEKLATPRCVALFEKLALQSSAATSGALKSSWSASRAETGTRTPPRFHLMRARAAAAAAGLR